MLTVGLYENIHAKLPSENTDEERELKEMKQEEVASHTYAKTILASTAFAP